MSKHRINLDDQTEALLDQYLDQANLKLDAVINQALQHYLVHQIGLKVAKAITADDTADLSKLLDHLVTDNIHNNY